MPQWTIVPVLNFFGSKNVNNWEYKLFRLNLYNSNTATNTPKFTFNYSFVLSLQSRNGNIVTLFTWFLI